MWNHVSGGDCSVAMALKYPKINCVSVITGGGHPLALRNLNELQHRGHRIIFLSSFQGGYNTYFDYLWKGNKIPFYKGCCYRGKEMHLERFYSALPGVHTSNIGFVQGEEDRAKRLKEQETKRHKFNFPILDYTREECEKLIRAKGMKPIGHPSYCWFCPKGDNPPEWAVNGIISEEGQAMRAVSRGLTLEKQKERT